MKTLALALAVAACGTSDVNVAGDYAISLINRANGCNFGNWTVGATSMATVTLTQSGADVTASVTGLGAVVLDLVLGSSDYTGRVTGDALLVSLFGTRSTTMGNCTYTFTSRIVATSTGDILTGTIDYQPATNGNPDCAAISACRSVQEFNGTRPPR
jgi:hypothetical protein